MVYLEYCLSWCLDFPDDFDRLTASHRSGTFPRPSLPLTAATQANMAASGAILIGSHHRDGTSSIAAEQQDVIDFNALPRSHLVRPFCALGNFPPLTPAL
ncbi:hypothetical protein PoB_000277000 [Plakobranchus ocellatus]|uniref:Uncharacterized protein n=1 Tax=Plakobranchus ocellatus TaxID=259542 RepID=A0AAV3XZL0_9GAST|nr:hypothetical protein PoB_000277000 [Plakobranchus ocellatus]